MVVIHAPPQMVVTGKGFMKIPSVLGRSRMITGRMVRWSRRTTTSTTISLPKTENWALHPRDKRFLEKVVGPHNQRLFYHISLFVGAVPPSASGSLVRLPPLDGQISRRSLSWRFARLLDKITRG